MEKFASVIVDISHEKVDRPFTYRIPEALADRLRPGMRVRIPFGAGDTLRTGYVTEHAGGGYFAGKRLQELTVWRNLRV